jgi:hypothetical protein
VRFVNSGDVYAVTQDELWLIRATREKIKLDEGLKGASAQILLGRKTFPRKVRGTAGPSAPVGMTINF